MNSKPKAKLKKKEKRNALVICRSGRRFWTTQIQFWEWVRNGALVKVQDSPLTGSFVREHEEMMVIRQNTVLSLARPNHLHEALASRRLRKSSGR